MNTISRFLLDIFYPNRCPCCSDFIRWDKLICSKCHKSIDPVFDRVCRKCGKEICICAEQLYYDSAVVPLRYENLVKEGILSLKRGYNKNFGEYTGKLIAGIFLDEYKDSHFDMIIPVPMSKKSLAKRGYNQAEIISREIAAALNIPLRNDILYKQEQKTSQHYLKRTARMLNITALKINDINLEGKSVIICDDVITTGSTVNRCAKLLKSRGAENVTLASAAQSKLR